MNLFFASPAFAAEQAQSPEWTFFIPLIAIIAVIYFLLIRPQNKRLRMHRDMIASLKRGDMVVTAGGLIGKLQRVQEDECLLEVAEGVRFRVLKGTISNLYEGASEAQKSDKKSG